jgi:hypothetical protein
MIFSKFWPTLFFVLVLSLVITALTFKDTARIHTTATSKLSSECYNIEDCPEQK